MATSKRAKADAPVVTSVVNDDTGAAQKLAEVMLEQSATAEIALAASPPEIPILGIIGEIFPFGAVGRREDGTRLKPGDVIRAGERVSITTVLAEFPPMGLSIMAKIP